MRTLLAVLAVLLIGCAPAAKGRVSQAAQPRTDREGWAIDRAQFYARQAGVQLQAEMTDITYPAGITKAAAYVSCPQKDKIPKLYIWRGCAADEKVCPDAYLDAVVAHEVCHVIYGETQSPCSVDEVRATECGARLQAGEKR